MRKFPCSFPLASFQKILYSSKILFFKRIWNFLNVKHLFESSNANTEKMQISNALCKSFILQNDFVLKENSQNSFIVYYNKIEYFMLM